jgi:hypothetical protein
MSALLAIFIVWVLGSYAIYRSGLPMWALIPYALLSMAAAAWFIYQDNKKRPS